MPVIIWDALMAVLQEGRGMQAECEPGCCSTSVTARTRGQA